jgi:hypothetical protein
MPRGAGNTDTPLADMLASIDRDFNQATNLLWQEKPLLAQALGLLNRKLSLVAAHALPQETNGEESYEELLVSISGSGIGFDAAEDFPVGTRLHLMLALKPSNITLELTGLVAGSESREQHGRKVYWIRVNFEQGNETAQELLIQHVVQRQCAQIREQAPAG